MLALAATSGLATAGLGLRSAGRSYGYDESVTVALFVDAPLDGPFNTQHIANNHPMFSFLEQLVWRAGGTSELWMRMIPAAAAGLTVALLMWWCGRRWGLRAGATGGISLALNPLFVKFGQEARGYTLMILAGLTATMLLFGYLDLENEDPPSWRSPAYVVACVFGLATHLYMAIVIASHVGLVIARRQFSPQWMIRWLTVGAVTIVTYFYCLPERRPGSFDPSFPSEVAWTVLGGTIGSVAVFGTLTGLTLWSRRSDILAVVLPALAIATVWAVFTPRDLYARFFVVLVPGVAVAAAWAAGQWRWLAAPTAVGCVLMAPFSPPPDSGLRETATYLLDEASTGASVCAIGSEALAAYTFSVPELKPSVPCDTVAIIGTWDRPDLERVRTDRPIVATFGDVVVRGRPRS